MKNTFINFLDEISFFKSHSSEKLARKLEHNELQLGEKHIQELELTNAECLLLKNGVSTGIVICNHNTDNIIRSEILNWFLRLPENYLDKFKIGKLTISNAHIISMVNHFHYLKNDYDLKDISKVIRRDFALDVSNRVITVDLSFNNCYFHGGIDISNATLKSMTIDSCVIGVGSDKEDFFYSNLTIKSSIYGCLTKITGNLHISDSQNFYNYGLNNKESNIHGTIYLPHIEVAGIFKVYEIILSHNLTLSFSKCKIFSVHDIICLKATISLLYGRFNNVYFHNSKFICDLEKMTEEDDIVTIEGQGLEADYFNFRTDCFNIGVISLDHISIHKAITFTESILIAPTAIDPQSNIDHTMSLRGAKISDLSFSKNLINLGEIDISESEISSVFVNRSKLVNYNSAKKYGIALDLSNAIINKSINFINKKETVKAKEQNQYNYDAIIASLEEVSKIYKGEDFTGKSQTSQESKGLASYLINPQEIEALKLVKEIEELVHDDIMNVGLPKALKENDVDYDHEAQNLFVGEVTMSSTQISGQVDFAGSLFYCPINDENNMKAINLRYLKVDGTLFLNDLTIKNKDYYFRTIGEVDLHMANTTQLFVNPVRGRYADTKWYLTGFQYESIHWNKKNKDVLSSLKWFEFNREDSNYRQPYEQLAKAINNSGDDSKAKEVIIRGRLKTYKNPLEYALFFILIALSKIGIPAWKSFFVLILIFISGSIYNNHAHTQGGFTANDTSYEIEFSPNIYTFNNMMPVSFSETNFSPNGKDILFVSTETFNLWHKIISTIFLTMFVIGIAKVTKK
ncbi:hypothetical protein [uncultured Kordia sp.]|uniref:hypothetical protein n=1 Tax=uncultured Kordia sp. TaxID=507699 RepID=UPI0026187721|nr:hypothetical protein [uncultured Kordia sp.]